MIDGLALRLFAGLLLGSLLVFGLHALLMREAPVEAAAPEVDARPDNGALLAELDSPGVWFVLLAGPDAALPAGAGPVVELDAEGRARLRRGPPVAESPGERWLAPALVLPDTGLAALGPPARAALLELLGRLSAGQGLRADQLLPVGVHAPAWARRILLRWLR